MNVLCVDRLLVEMCSVPALMASQYGYIVSPGYPRRYPAAVSASSASASASVSATDGNCSLTVVVPSTCVVRVQVVDMFLASYTANNNRRVCLDRSAPTHAFNHVTVYSA